MKYDGVMPAVAGVKGRWVTDRDLFVLLAKTFGCTVLRRPTEMVDLPQPEAPVTAGRRGIPRPQPPRVVMMRQVACTEETFRVRAGGEVWLWAEVATTNGDRRWHMGLVVARGTRYHHVPRAESAEDAPPPTVEPFEEVGLWFVHSSRSMADQLALAGVTVTPEPAESEAA